MAKVLLGVVIAAVVYLGIPASSQAEPAKAVPAWCGDGWQPTMLQEVVKDGKVTLTPIAGTGGSNFGACVSVPQNGKDSNGKDTTVYVPTYPENPSSVVTFGKHPDRDEIVGGKMVTVKEGDKDVTKWMPIEPTVVKAKK